MDFSIKDAARMVGLTPRTLRYYESIGLLPKAERTSGNYRLFNVTDIIDLIRIKRLTGLGFDLQHVRQIMDDPTGPTSPEATTALDAQKQLLTQQIEELHEKRTKIEEIQNLQAPLDVATEFADLEHAWADAQSELDAEDRLKLEIELLAAFADDHDRLKYETLTRTSIEKHDDPNFRELRELDARLEALEPDAPPEEIKALTDDYVRVLGPIRARFAPMSEKTLALASAMEEFTYNEAQLTVITTAREQLRPNSPQPSSQAPSDATSHPEHPEFDPTSAS